MQTLTEIKSLLAARGIQPKHRLGQNFLHDKNQLAKLVDAAGIVQGELVLEVGPGTGTLTEALVDRGAEVVACELDADMAAIVRERLGDRVKLIEGDCLAKQRHLNPEIVSVIGGRRFKLVANLPYQAASPLMSTLLIEHPNCVGQWVTIQREVADRLQAVPSTKQYGPLTVIVQSLADVERVATLSPGCFWPPPEVTSAMVAIHPRSVQDRLPGLEDPVSRQAFARFVTSLFTKRRKQLGGTLGRNHVSWTAVESEGITPEMRPEALAPSQLVRLWRVMPNDGGPSSC